MAQLMPLPLAVSCFSKIHIGFTFLVPANWGSSGQMAVKLVCVCVCVCACMCACVGDIQLMSCLVQKCRVCRSSRRSSWPLHTPVNALN